VRLSGALWDPEENLNVKNLCMFKLPAIINLIYPLKEDTTSVVNPLVWLVMGCQATKLGGIYCNVMGGSIHDGSYLLIDIQHYS
jgi:hypothetical protein